MPEVLPAAAESLRVRAARQRQRRERSALVILLLLSVAVFGGGITWGLPSRAADPFLFGRRRPWTGAEILALTGPREPSGDKGADVDRDPLKDRSHKLLINQTDRDRAEIVRRYRLFSYQPDEMVTLMALAQMRPGAGDLDPRLYQYGGLWVYAVGGLLKASSMLHVIHLTADLAYYLDHPEAFARFYVVARLYVVAWGMVGAWAVFALARRLTRGSLLAACMACFCFIMMPGVVNMAHEAKPHLPGVVLMLLAVLAMTRYVRTAERNWWRLGCVLSGMAVGMVLAAWPILVLPPLAALLVRQEWRPRLWTMLTGSAIAGAVYCASNPYVCIHLLNNRPLLRSNLGNTQAMFEPGLSVASAENAARLIAEGASVFLACGGALTTMIFMFWAIFHRQRAARHPAWLLIAPAVLIGAQFLLFAKDQPAEYARFSLFLGVALVIACVAGGWVLLERLEWRPGILILLGLAAAMPGSRYYAGFVNDAFPTTSRLMAAELLEGARRSGVRSIGVAVEPAPYAVPPLNLFEWRVELLPEDYDPAGDPSAPEAVVRTVDHPAALPAAWMAGYTAEFVDPSSDRHDMSWASKPFAVLQRAGRQ